MRSHRNPEREARAPAGREVDLELLSRRQALMLVCGGAALAALPSYGSAPTPARAPTTALASDLHYSSVRAFADAIRAKKISSEEAVKACLARIEAVNPKINAVVKMADDALARARKADAAL